MVVIDYDKGLVIKNTDQLAHGTGAKYLECLIAHNWDYVAYKWRRTLPVYIPGDHIIIRM